MIHIKYNINKTIKFIKHIINPNKPYKSILENSIIYNINKKGRLSEMRCIGKFKEDRICDLCKITNNKDYLKCKKIYNKQILLNNKIFYIKTNCPYKCSKWEEYQEYDYCNKNKQDCKCTLKCEKYIEI